MSDTRRILVIEDEMELREIIVDLLKLHHTDVTSASNGAEALALVKKEEFTLILSDIKMPVMTGLEFFVQAQLDLHLTPVVFITAFGDHENIMTALRLGAFDFIKKPFDEDEILKVVDRALDVGYRKKLIAKELENISEEQKKKIESQERMISLLQVTNNKKRVS